MIKGSIFSGKKLFQYVTEKTQSVWGSETEALSKYVLKEVFNYNLTDFISNIPKEHDTEKLDQLNTIILRLENQEPIQYILGYTYFLGRKFMVTPDVLIPRPETEELVELVKRKIKFKNPRILDIGVGSGCIGISLAIETGVNTFTGVDYDQVIIDVAKVNAKGLGVEMDTQVVNILENNIHKSGFDVIVSNPPYVLPSEKKYMRNNVINFEPENALFVPENDPLIFFHRITELATEKLNRTGMLFFEINESFGSDVKKILRKKNFSDVEVEKDIHGKNRFVCGQLPYS